MTKEYKIGDVYRVIMPSGDCIWRKIGVVLLHPVLNRVVVRYLNSSGAFTGFDWPRQLEQEGYSLIPLSEAEVEMWEMINGVSLGDKRITNNED